MRSDGDGAVAGGESGVRREPATPARRAGLREDLRIDARFGDVALILHSTWGLFSPREIDPGTRLLLDQVRPGVADRCLDLGCGYGPIGLCLAARAPAGSVMLVDRDFVAVDYARANARRNGLDQVEARLSNGIIQVLNLVRGDTELADPAPDTRLEVGDRVVVHSRSDAMMALRSSDGTSRQLSRKWPI